MKSIDNPKPYKYGFALSGGSARAFAHLGAIKALKENGVIPDIISATSAGAIAGALIADGYEPEEVCGLFNKMSHRNFTDFSFGKPGIFKPTKIRSFLEKHLHARSFEELQIPLSVTVTDFDKGVPVNFSSGPLIDVIVASCCIPIVFTPTNIGGVNYVDGGMFHNFPVTPIRKSCEIVVGIYVNTLDNKSYSNLKSVAEKTIYYLVRPNTAVDRNLCDILIELPGMVQYSMTDIHLSGEIFENGYKGTTEYLQTINLQFLHSRTEKEYQEFPINQNMNKEIVFN